MVILCYSPEFSAEALQRHQNRLSARSTSYVVVRGEREVRRHQPPDLRGPRGTVIELLETRPMMDEIRPGGVVQDECSILVDGRDFFTIVIAGSGRYAVVGSDMPLINYLQKTIIGASPG